MSKTGEKLARYRLTNTLNRHIIGKGFRDAGALFSRKDALVIISALALACAVFVGIYAFRARKTYADRVDIYVDGALYASSRLGADESITVERDGMKNVLRVTEDGFYMEYSSCINQLCVMQGTVNRQNSTTRAFGAHIICLPNRIDAHLAEADGAPDA